MCRSPTPHPRFSRTATHRSASDVTRPDAISWSPARAFAGTRPGVDGRRISRHGTRIDRQAAARIDPGAADVLAKRLRRPAVAARVAEQLRECRPSRPGADSRSPVAAGAAKGSARSPAPPPGLLVSAPGAPGGVSSAPPVLVGVDCGTGSVRVSTPTPRARPVVRRDAPLLPRATMIIRHRPSAHIRPGERGLAVSGRRRVAVLIVFGGGGDEAATPRIVARRPAPDDFFACTAASYVLATRPNVDAPGFCDYECRSRRRVDVKCQWVDRCEFAAGAATRSEFTHPTDPVRGGGAVNDRASSPPTRPGSSLTLFPGPSPLERVARVCPRANGFGPLA